MDIRETATIIQERLRRDQATADDSKFDHINPRNECPLCGGVGYVRVTGGVVRCECQKQKIARKKLAEIPERYRDSTFANYVPEDAQQQAALDRISGDFTESFFIHGDYSRGKTHLATAQYRRLIEIERPAMFFPMSELLHELRRAELDRDFFCVVRDRAMHADTLHLFVDDIDKFKPTDFKSEVLFDLFDCIWKRKLG